MVSHQATGCQYQDWKPCHLESLSHSRSCPPPLAEVTTDFSFLCTLPASLYASISTYKIKSYLLLPTLLHKT